MDISDEALVDLIEVLIEVLVVEVLMDLEEAEEDPGEVAVVQESVEDPESAKDMEAQANPTPSQLTR